MTWTCAVEPTTPAPGAASTDTRRGLTPWFAAFGLSSAAPGVPFVLVTVELERRAAVPLWFAGVAVARLGPYLVVSPVAGVLAARVAPRLLFVSSAVVRAAIASAIGVSLVGGAPPVVPVALLFVLVATGCASYPALMRLVEAHAHNRARGASFAAGLESAAFWAGPALGGALLAAGPATATSVCAAMCIASALLATSATANQLPAATGSTVDVARDSVRRVLDGAVRPAVGAVLALNGVAGFVTTLLVRLPADLGIGGPPEYGRLSIALGGGAAVAALVVVAPSRLGARAATPLVCGGTAVVVLGAVPHLLTATVACAVLGASLMVSEMVAATHIATEIAAARVAPVVGVLDAAMVAAMVVGAGAAPVALGTTGTRIGVIAAGLVALAGVAGSPSLRRTRAAHSFDRPEQPPVGATS